MGCAVMAHRVYIKHLDSTLVTKEALHQTVGEMGFTYVTVDDIRIIRSRRMSAMEQKWCSAFITMLTADDVDLVVGRLSNSCVSSLSPRPIHAERAIPRMSTLGRALKNEPAWEEQDSFVGDGVQVDSQASGVSAAVSLCTEFKKEENSGVSAAVSRWTKVKKEENSGVSAAVGHWTKVKKEENDYKRKLEEDQPPLTRRSQLRANLGWDRS